MEKKSFIEILVGDLENNRENNVEILNKFTDKVISSGGEIKSISPLLIRSVRWEMADLGEYSVETDRISISQDHYNFLIHYISKDKIPYNP